MKSKKKMKAVVGLLALTLVVGSLAYFSKVMSIDNPFSTKKYGGETVEKFTPKNDWEPGGQVTKEVQAKNTGDYDLYVRVKFDEKWERDGQVIEGTKLASSDKSKFFPASADTSVTGGSSVYKHLAGVLDGSWKEGSDGYYYYDTTLKSGEMTTKLLDYVTLCKDANMGTYEVSKMMYALVDESVTADQLKDSDYNRTEAPETIPDGMVLYQKKVVSLDSENAGLAGANYTLTITTELLQANKDAAKASGWIMTPSK
jgi:alternate signal-mediated exported protein